jgi:hypothetical protein
MEDKITKEKEERGENAQSCSNHCQQMH